MKKDKSIPKLEKQLQKDAKVLLNHAIKHGVPAEWYWHHLEGHVFRAANNISSDIDWLLGHGERIKFYDKIIVEFERRKKISEKKME